MAWRYPKSDAVFTSIEALGMQYGVIADSGNDLEPQALFHKLIDKVMSQTLILPESEPASDPDLEPDPDHTITFREFL